MLAEVRHGGGTYLTPGAAATIPQLARGVPATAPALGRDSEAVLADILGMSSGEIGRLHDTGLVASADR